MYKTIYSMQNAGGREELVVESSFTYVSFDIRAHGDVVAEILLSRSDAKDLALALYKELDL